MFRASRCTPYLSVPAGSTFSVTNSGLKCDLDRLLVAVHQVQLIEDLPPRGRAFQDLKDKLQQLPVARLGRCHFTLDKVREVFAGRQHLERDSGGDFRRIKSTIEGCHGISSLCLGWG